jgi:hypothetical protein
MKKRKQPVMTFNRISRKIDGVIGLLKSCGKTPRHIARTPKHEAGAELASAALRYVLDEQEWKAKSPLVALDGAVDGIGGIEIEIEQGDQGDPEIGFEDVDIQSFFYDPRSFEPDFEDARYMGVGKWVDHDIARRCSRMPRPNASGDSELTNSTDRETRWFSVVGPAEARPACGHLVQAQGRMVLGNLHRLGRPDGGQVLPQGREGKDSANTSCSAATSIRTATATASCAT